MDLLTARRLCQIAATIDSARFAKIFNACVEDPRRCAQAVAAAARGEDGPARHDQFWARATLRSFFSLLEAITFEMRLILRQAVAARLSDMSPSEISLLSDSSFELDGAGRPVSRPRFIPIERNLRFAFPRYARLFGATTSLDTGGQGWEKLSQTIKVRNRITHPKSPEDLDLTPDEIMTAMHAITWYSETMTSVLHEIEELMRTATAIVNNATAEMRRHGNDNG